MDLYVLLVAVALGTDAGSVGLALAPRVRTFRQHFRLIWHFAWFQFMMTVLGAITGGAVAAFVQTTGRYISCALLSLVAIHMFLSAIRSRPDDEELPDATRGWSLVILAVATSIDAFAVGVSFGLVNSPVILPSVVIGAVAGLMTFAGLRVGKGIHRTLGNKAEFLGAAILAALAMKQLL